MKKFNDDNNYSGESESDGETKHTKDTPQSRLSNPVLGNSTPVKAGPRHRKVLEKYLDEKIRLGEMIPLEISKSKYVPSLTGIGIEIQDRFGAYLHNSYLVKSVWFIEKASQILGEQIESAGKIVPTPADERACRLKKAQRDESCAETLRSWLKEIKESGCKLKQQNNIIGKIDRIWVSQQSGVHYADLYNERAQMVLKHAKKNIGLESHLPSFNKIIESFSYKKLLEFGADCRRSELQHLNNPENQINNTRHALLKFLRLLKLDQETIIGSEFGTRFTAAFKEAVAMVGNKNTRKKFARELRRWHEYYTTLLKLENFPPDFYGALKFLFETTGTRYEDIFGKQLKRRVGAWARGINMPSVKNLKDIYKIEEFFKLPYGTLAKRIVFNQPFANRNALTLNFPSLTHEQKRKIVILLPADFPVLDIERQKEIVDVISEQVLNKARSEHGMLIQRLYKNTYRLRFKDFNAQLQSDIHKLIEYKTEDYPPPGYVYSVNKWSGNLKEGTVQIFINSVESVFGVLSLPPEKGGYGVKPEQMNLILIYLHNTLRSLSIFMRKRLGREASSSLYRMFGMFLSHINSMDGWVTQSPWLAERLEPIPGLLTEEQVLKAKTNWKEFVQDVLNESVAIYSVVRRIYDKNPFNIDSHMPILPILESDRPLLFLKKAIEDYEQIPPCEHTKPLLFSTHVKNIVLLRILMETGLRVKNMRKMTWKSDNTGHLQRDNEGNYYLEIPYTEFKNWKSNYFGPKGRKSPYRVRLSKRLIPWIDKYLLECRPRLIEAVNASNKMDLSFDAGFLFVANFRSNAQMLSYFACNRLMRQFTLQFLVYNPITNTGIPGVMPFSMHKVRHIIATHILKHTGSYADAGAAIQDSEETARKHYARYAPSDRDQKIRPLITELYEDESN